MELDLGMGRTAVERSRPTTPRRPPERVGTERLVALGQPNFHRRRRTDSFRRTRQDDDDPHVDRGRQPNNLRGPVAANDDSYEIGGPLGGRFQADSLSAAGSTTFVMNKYGDMYTRTFDFDSSGSDSIFFRYSWEDQSDKPSAPNSWRNTRPQHRRDPTSGPRLGAPAQNSR